MKTIALQEHFATQEIMDAWKKVDPGWRDLALKASTDGEGARRLLELGPERLSAMDEAGIDASRLSQLDLSWRVSSTVFQICKSLQGTGER